MLFRYEYIHHDFEKLHEFFKHTVLEVWCKPDGAFDIEKLHEDFRPIVNKMKIRLLKPIQEIYDICLTLNAGQLAKITEAFNVNNSIEELCEGRKEPILYEEIKAINVDLEKKLKVFVIPYMNMFLGKQLSVNAINPLMNSITNLLLIIVRVSALFVV